MLRAFATRLSALTLLSLLAACGSQLDSPDAVSDNSSNSSNSCALCHAAPGWDIAATDLLDHPGTGGWTITATHYDDPSTPGDYVRNVRDGKIEGYIINAAQDRSCQDCHNESSPASLINEEWARSGHGGKLLQQKEAFGENAASTQTIAPGWSYMDWDASNRASCQRCHTATGASSFLSDPANYDSALNDFSYMDSNQNELLFCWGCHADSSGTLRNPGAIEPDGLNDTYSYQGVPVVFPDVGNSNVCSACHSGHGNKEEMVKDRETRAGSSSSHHLPAAGILFSAESHLGYEYNSVIPGLDYSDPQIFAHRYLGLNGDSPESGSGPCVACHMGDGAEHTFEVVTKDAITKEITGIVHKATVCDTCHRGNFEMTPTFLQGKSTQFYNSVELLGNYVNQTYGFTNYNSVPIGNSISDIEAYGALQNYLILEGEEPGAFAHNSTYAKRLVYDSIDWLNNGSINADVSIPLTTHYNAALWFGYTGGLHTGTYSAPRP